MAQSNTATAKILDISHVSPPPGSNPTTSLPLTFFDLPWFTCSPVKRLFFYDFPYPTFHFTQTLVPLLKQSLSFTLQHFFPFAGSLMCPLPPQKPYIQCTGCDSVLFTVMESTADFHHVISNFAREVTLLHPFAAQLPPARVSTDRTQMFPLLAVQVTLFPDIGICIGATYSHNGADGRAFMHFMASWASIHRSGGDSTSLQISLPSCNKDVIKDPNGFESIFLKEYWTWVSSLSLKYHISGPTLGDVHDKARATFIVGPAHSERLKHLVTTKSGNMAGTEQLHASRFVVACAFMWVCLVKLSDNFTTHNSSDDDDDEKFYYLVFAFDCRNRVEFPIPVTYFGNCLAPGIVKVKKSELMGEDGIVMAARAIGIKVTEMKGGAIRDVETWREKLNEMFASGRHVAISGSPKLCVYDTDFGWGKPRKVELVHIDTGGAISMAECRDEQGGIEFGVALNKNQIDAFICIFEHTLKLL